MNSAKLSNILLLLLQAYLLGSISIGYMIYRYRQGGDVRTTGSGNIGASNLLRVAGVYAGASTFILDAAKGYLAVAIAGTLSGDAPQWTSLAAVMVILGHMFPVFLKFHGGKGVATGLGAFLAIAPGPALWALLVFVIVVAGSRYLSLASIAGVTAFPFVLLLYPDVSRYVLAASMVGAILIVSRHHSNIRRLRMGTERRINDKEKLRDAGSGPH